MIQWVNDWEVTPRNGCLVSKHTRHGKTCTGYPLAAMMAKDKQVKNSCMEGETEIASTKNSSVGPQAVADKP